jgi:uncharacterized protein DUF5916
MTFPLRGRSLCFVLALFLGAPAAFAQAPPEPASTTPPPTGDLGPLRIERIQTPITIDGDISDAGWQQAGQVTTWFETNPGDNLEPKVKNVAWLAYDDKFFYAAFEFADPSPKAIKAPYGDHDFVPSYTDYGGVIVDPRNDGKSAQMFLANPRGIQYDAISNDSSGEDQSPDWFWDSAGRITESGWTLEMRIPFSSLRYEQSDPTQWRIMLYRNMPREFRYQMFTSRLPRDSNCFICNTRPLVGLAGLPSGSHWVVAPYASGNQTAEPRAGLGSSLQNGDPEGAVGVDGKWLPNPNVVLDATVNPDFSQIESDAAQITANERFALFFPERRPFFLEGIDLFATPFQAVYTRSFTDPKWGLRTTGQRGRSSYLLLVGDDQGGGSVIIPGSNGSSFADQEFGSKVAIGRWRTDFGTGGSFVSMIYSGREIDGGGSNRLIGPDVRWRPTPKDNIGGQFLVSRSETPERPDLADEWTGQTLSDWAGIAFWGHTEKTWDHFVQYQKLGPEFRADNGFIPQVGYSELYDEWGYTWYPKDKPVSRFRLSGSGWYDNDSKGDLLGWAFRPAFGLDAILNSFVRVELQTGEQLAIEKTFRYQQIHPTIELRPGKVLSFVSLTANLGDQLDYANDRLGHGGTVTLSSDIRPTTHLLLNLSGSRRRLDVTAEDGRSGRLFTADVARLRANYTFNSRTWVRVIEQYVHTERDPSLYKSAGVDPEEGGLTGSIVFAYKLNWQTVLYLGYADNQELDELNDLQQSNREAFFKVSYAFQR